MAQFSTDYTAQNLSGIDGLMGSVASRAQGGCYVRFFWDQVRLKDGKVETRLALVRQPVGDVSTVSVRHIKPEAAARDFPQEWHNFNTYQDGAPSGTPLTELPGLTQSMIGIVIANGIRCVEDLADIPAEVAAQGGMDLNKSRQIAIKWLQQRDENADDIDMAGRLAEIEARMNSLQRENETLRQSNMRLEARAEARAEMRGAVAQGAPAGASGLVMVADPEGLGMPGNDADMFGPVASDDDIDPLAD